MSDLQRVKEKTLVFLAKNVKNSIIEGINAHEPETFYLGIGLLQAIEAEIRDRGFDPTAPVFGPDLMGEIVEVKVSLLDKGR